MLSCEIKIRNYFDSTVTRVEQVFIADVCSLIDVSDLIRPLIRVAQSDMGTIFSLLLVFSCLGRSVQCRPLVADSLTAALEACELVHSECYRKIYFCLVTGGWWGLDGKQQPRACNSIISPTNCEVCNVSPTIV